MLMSVHIFLDRYPERINTPAIANEKVFSASCFLFDYTKNMFDLAECLIYTILIHCFFLHTKI